MITMVLFIWLLTLLTDFPPTIHKGTLRIHLEGSPRCTQGASVGPGYMFLASSPDTCHPSFNSPGCPFFVCSHFCPQARGRESSTGVPGCRGGIRGHLESKGQTQEDAVTSTIHQPPAVGGVQPEHLVEK